MKNELFRYIDENHEELRWVDPKGSGGRYASLITMTFYIFFY